MKRRIRVEFDVIDSQQFTDDYLTWIGTSIALELPEAASEWVIYIGTTLGEETE